jgi:hypothetical protein
VLPDGTVIRERKKAQKTSESSARRWAEARERHLLLHGTPKPVREEGQKTPTLREFAPRTDALAYLIVLLGGEAGLRCGEIMALEWTRRL